jgi:hypothetical protein
VATVLIILHLFCVAIGVASNAGEQRSALGRTLRNIPAAPKYLQALFLDVAYDFELGGAAPRNGVHRLALLPAGKDRNSEAALARLPTDDVVLRVRRQRYQNLAFHIAELDRVFAESPDDQTRLPITVAENWIARLGLEHKPYTVRCERVDSPRWQEDEESFDASGKARRSSGENSSFDIHLVWSTQAGHYEGFRAQEESLTAKSIDGSVE